MSAIASQISCVSMVYLNRVFRRGSKKTSKLRVTGLSEGNPPVTGGIPSQRASNAENVSIWWRHHEKVDVVTHPYSTSSNGLIKHVSTLGHDITMTSQWPWWHFKSPASRLFTQPFIQTQIKENLKAPRHWPLCGEFTGTGEFPAQRTSYAENVSIWWRHHVQPTVICGCKYYSLPISYTLFA